MTTAYDAHTDFCPWHVDQNDADCECDSDTAPYVIFLNGPPGSGKDTLADGLCDTLMGLRHNGGSRSVHRAAFKGPMVEMGCAMFGYPVDQYDQRKDERHPHWGMTLRAWMIDFSENYMKPRHGQGVWGKALLARSDDWWNTKPAVVIVTDLGFSSEYCEVAHATRRDRCMTIQLKRPGVGWGNDSRGCVPALPKAWHFRLNNASTPSRLLLDAWEMLEARWGNEWWIARQPDLFA